MNPRRSNNELTIAKIPRLVTGFVSTSCFNLVDTSQLNLSAPTFHFKPMVQAVGRSSMSRLNLLFHALESQPVHLGHCITTWSIQTFHSSSVLVAMLIILLWFQVKRLISLGPHGTYFSSRFESCWVQIPLDMLTPSAVSRRWYS